jgi:hypothetical protein
MLENKYSTKSIQAPNIEKPPGEPAVRGARGHRPRAVFRPVRRRGASANRGGGPGGGPCGGRPGDPACPSAGRSGVSRDPTS